MNIKPVASPHQVAPTQTNSRAQAEAKARAVAMLTNQPAQVNQNAVSPEEVAVARPQARQAGPRMEEVLNTMQAEVEQAQEIIEQTEEGSQEVTEESPELAPEPQVQEEETLASRQFAQLARKERQWRMKVQQAEQAIKAREEAIAQREAAITAQSEQYKTGYISQDQIKADPLSVLQNLGISYDQLTQDLIQRQSMDPNVLNIVNQLKAQIEELKAEQTNTKKTWQEQQQEASQNQYKQVIGQITREAKDLVQADPEAYEAIAKTGTVSEVVKLIEDTWNKDGVLLSVEEAAQEVENYLVEENLKMFNKISKIKRRATESQAQGNAKGPINKQTDNESTEPKSQAIKTLTNNIASTRKLSARERALLAFEGKLKS